MASITTLAVSVILPERPLQAFRVVRGDGNIDDYEFKASFRSNYELGRHPRGWEQRNVVIQMGLSMFVRPSQAEGTARRFPAIGAHVAELALVHGLGFAFAPTGPAGHLTVWGRPLQLVEAVVDVFPVSF